MVHHENLLTAPRSKCSATPPFPACILLILKQNILATVEDELDADAVDGRYYQVETRGRFWRLFVGPWLPLINKKDANPPAM
jgi:hypothetical protein